AAGRLRAPPSARAVVDSALATRTACARWFRCRATAFRVQPEAARPCASVARPRLQAPWRAAAPLLEPCAQTIAARLQLGDADRGDRRRCQLFQSAQLVLMKWAMMKEADHSDRAV